MTVRCLLDYVAALQMLVSGNGVADFKAVLRARRDFKKWRSEYKAERMKIQQMRTADAAPELSGFSILWQYYVKGIKKFSAL